MIRTSLAIAALFCGAQAINFDINFQKLVQVASRGSKPSKGGDNAERPPRRDENED